MGKDHSAELDGAIFWAVDFIRNYRPSSDNTLDQDEVKHIYGNKGCPGILAGLDGDRDKEYHKMTDFIKQKYQQLKIESLAALISRKGISVDSLGILR